MRIYQIRRFHILLTGLTLLLISMLTGCSSAQIIKPVPGSLKGRMTFISVRVKKIADIKSTTVRDQVKSAVSNALPEQRRSDVIMRLEIIVEKWKAKDQNGAPDINTHYAGIKIEIEARVKVIDAVNGNAIAEFRVSADFQQIGRMRRPYSTNDPEYRCLKKLAAKVKRELY